MIQTALSKVLDWKWKQIVAAQQAPLADQARSFEAHKRRMALTSLGSAMRLDQFDCYEDFARQSPSFEYSDFEGWIQKQLTGEPSMFAGPTEFIGLSSGTTGSNSKKILYNRPLVRSLDQFQQSVAAILQRHFAFKAYQDARFSWGSTPVVETNAHGVSEGYVSGYLSSRSPRLLRRQAFPQVETQKITDMRLKTQQAARELEGVSLKLMTGVPSYILSFLEDLKKLWAVDNFKQTWPDLNTFVYSATAITCYKEPLERLLGRPLNYLGLYASTEGAYGYEIPSLNGGQNGLYSFHFGSLVYGFRRPDSGAQLSMADLKEGDEVELLISSPNGLTQYRTGDLLRIRSVAPVILFEILGRVGQGLNVATEKVSLSQLQAAVTEVSARQQFGLKHFFVYPGRSPQGKPCYDWVLVPEARCQLELNRLQRDLDEALKRQNGDYRENREDLYFLDPPQVKLLPSVVIDTYFKKYSQRGQLKMKSTFDSPAAFEGFLKDIWPAQEVA